MKRYYYLMACLLFFCSCGVRYKSVPYFKDLPDSAVLQEDIDNYSPLKIQRNDILAISVTSLNQEASAIFNTGNTSSSTNNSGNSNVTSNTNGFLVDGQGDIQLPLVGSIKVAGLSTSAARALIQESLLKFLKEPVVSLKLANFKVSVLGDVANPGVFPVQNERTTITEALGMAGDLTITGLRNNVLLVRENQGKRQYVRLDLQSKTLFNSPYYYLQNNDVLYVQPGNAKYASVDTSYRNIGLLLSTLSIITLIITRL